MFGFMERSSRALDLLFDLARGVAVLTALWAVGAGLRTVIALPLPGSLWGMVLLFLLLRLGWLPEAWVARAARTFLAALGLLFVPVGVGIVAYESLVRANLLPITVALLVGSAVTVCVAAWATGWVRP